MGSLEAEKNRNQRRDKRRNRRRYGMRTDDSARDLADFKRRQIEQAMNSGWWPGVSKSGGPNA